MRRTSTGKPPGYWAAYFNDLKERALADFMNVNTADDPDMIKTNAWAKVANGWDELAEYHREEGT